MSYGPSLRRRDLLIAGAALGASTGGVRAQGFPSRPVKWVCYQSAGGSLDQTIRAAQPFLQQQGLRTQIEYVLGGGGNVARTELFNSAPNGYGMMVDSSPDAALGEVVEKAAFKASEFEPIYGWNIEGWQICAKKGSPIRTIKDLVALSQKRPVIAGDIGRGGASHLQLLLLQQATGIRMNIVHFSGSAQVYPQVLGSNIDIACSGPDSGSRLTDQLQFLCIFRDKENALPGVPSAKAQGYDVVSIDQMWYAQTGPKVPEDRLNRLETAFANACKAPGFAAAQARAGVHGFTPLSRIEVRKILHGGYSIALKYQKELSSG